MATGDVASPGHKLGQIVGVLLEQLLGDPLRQFASRYQLYCDCKGSRPGVRTGNKVTWIDSRGNRHDLDYVLERGGSVERRGDPVAFIESAWRRYTKHSRNKSGELEGALLPLKVTYTTVRFLRVILAGEWSEGGLQQLRSAGIEVLHIPFRTIVDAFRAQGLKIDYPETAATEEKAALNRILERLNERQLGTVSAAMWRAIEQDYRLFERKMANAITEVPFRVRVITLYGDEVVYQTVAEAIRELENPTTARELNLAFARGYEVFIDYASGSVVTGRFQTKTELVQFLKRMGS
jgi:hypothetical protein